MLVLASGVLALASCTETAVIGDGCGNFVLESGEDCDSPDAEVCTATCRHVCDPFVVATCGGPMAGTCCPADMACGADGQCRAPSGTFSSPVVASFEVLELSVADLDGDLVDDLLGASSGKIIALYGAQQLPLEARVVRSAPPATGQITLGNYNSDPRPDVVLPTLGGLFTYETNTGTPEAVVFPAFADPDRIHARATAVLSGAAYRLDRIGTEMMEIIGTSGSGQRPCGVSFGLERVTGRALHPYIDQPGAGSPRALVPMVIAEAAPGADPIVCIDGVTGPGQQFPLTHPFGPVQAVAGADAFFAHLNPASLCPELVFAARVCTGPACPARITATVVMDGIGIPGACAVDSASRRAFLGIPFAAVTLATKYGVVTSNGVYDSNDTSPMPVPITSPPTGTVWFSGTAGDFDGDNREDFAVTTLLVDGVAVYQQRQGANPQQWRVVDVPTTGFVYGVTSGDFDGDGYDDIVFSSLRAFVDILSPTPPVDISIAYGGPSTFTDAAPVVSVDGLRSLGAAPFADPTLPIELDQFDDVVIAHEDKVSVMYSSANRQLFAPWRDREARQCTAAIAGNFIDENTPAIIAGFAGRNAAAGMSASNVAPAALRLVRGPQTLEEQGMILLDDDKSVIVNAVTVNVPQPGGDLMLAFHPNQGSDDHCVSFFHPSQLRLRKVPCSLFLAGTVPPEAVAAIKGVRAVHAVGDGTLVVLSDIAGGAVVFRWTLTYEGMAPRLSNPISLEESLGKATGAAETTCLGATSAELGVDAATGFGAGAKEIILSCLEAGSTKLRIHALYASGDSRPDAHRLVAELPVMFATLATGDVDGDGLDDILVHEVGSAVRAYLQCDSHGTCGGGP
jgi:hypothetical protein